MAGLEGQETELFDQIRALDARILEVDNVPRVSLDFVGAQFGPMRCVCVKMWSESRQEAAYLETWYDPDLFDSLDQVSSVAEVLFDGPMGIKANFEQSETRYDR